MDLKSPEEEVDEFLASKPSWLRKILQFDHSFSSDDCPGTEAIGGRTQAHRFRVSMDDPGSEQR